MFLKAKRLYDSHTHFIATGEFSSGLSLQNLRFENQLQEMTLDQGAYRAHWLIGFGWNLSELQFTPHRRILDSLYPNIPVFFMRNDGHGSWLNSKALEELGLESEDGLLFEIEHLKAWDLLPKYTEEQQRLHILKACSVYNNAGFTHVRDMSCTEDLWQRLRLMSAANELTVAIEENITSHDINDFEMNLGLAARFKSEETATLRMKGIKIFYDGTLGAETAYLSQPYGGSEGRGRGRTLWSLEDVAKVLTKTWEQGLEVSVHTIGDQAAHDIISLARLVSSRGAVGRLNLEHAQILRPETIQMMKPLHVHCHMQPCHWLSDKRWLKEKLGSLHKYAFPMEALRLAKIPMFFGCDSPIEASSFWSNYQALQEAPKEGIRVLNEDILTFHIHPDAQFADSTTVFEDQKVKELIFCGRTIINN